MGVEYNEPAHLLDRYIKGGDINGNMPLIFDSNDSSITCMLCIIIKKEVIKIYSYM